MVSRIPLSRRFSVASLALLSVLVSLPVAAHAQAESGGDWSRGGGRGSGGRSGSSYRGSGSSYFADRLFDNPFSGNPYAAQVWDQFFSSLRPEGRNDARKTPPKTSSGFERSSSRTTFESREEAEARRAREARAREEDQRRYDRYVAAERERYFAQKLAEVRQEFRNDTHEVIDHAYQGGFEETPPPPSPVERMTESVFAPFSDSGDDDDAAEAPGPFREALEKVRDTGAARFKEVIVDPVVERLKGIGQDLDGGLVNGEEAVDETDRVLKDPRAAKKIRFGGLLGKFFEDDALEDSVGGPLDRALGEGGQRPTLWLGGAMKDVVRGGFERGVETLREQARQLGDRLPDIWTGGKAGDDDSNATLRAGSLVSLHTNTFPYVGLRAIRGLWNYGSGLVSSLAETFGFAKEDRD